MTAVCRGRLPVLLLLALSISSVFCRATQAESKFPASEWVKRDTRTKLSIIQAFIAEIRKTGVILRLPPEYYVKEVDGIVDNAIKTQDEKELSNSVGVTIHTIAAMDGDWDNGENRVEHAKRLLGPAQFEFFKEAFPRKYAALLRDRTESSDHWKDIGVSGILRISCDVATLSFVSKTVVRVWAKTEYTNAEEGLDDLKKRGIYKPEYNNYDHDLYLNKVDCAGNRFTPLADYTYGKDGKLIDTFDFPESWSPIEPGSVIEIISKAACSESP